MTPFNQNERNMISIFLTDTSHQKDIRKKLESLTENYPQEHVLGVIGRIERQGILSQEDADYLRKKIEKLYQK